MFNNVYKYFTIDIKNYILTFLDKKCFKCEKIISFCNKEIHFNYYPYEYNNDYTKYSLCFKCYSNLYTINTNNGLLSYG